MMRYTSMIVKNCDCIDWDQSKTYESIFAYAQDLEGPKIIFDLRGSNIGNGISELLREVGRFTAEVVFIGNVLSFSAAWWELLIKSFPPKVKFSIYDIERTVEQYVTLVDLLDVIKSNEMCTLYPNLAVSDKFERLRRRDAKRYAKFWKNVNMPPPLDVEQSFVLDLKVTKDNAPAIKLTNTIPKILHQVWISDKECQDPLYLDCQEAQARLLKKDGWEIMQWTTKNCDVSVDTYTKEMFNLGNYALASEYFRVLAVYLHGGFSVDLDVKFTKSISPFIYNKVFLMKCDRTLIDLKRRMWRYPVVETLYGAVSKSAFFKNVLELLSYRTTSDWGDNHAVTLSFYLANAIGQACNGEFSYIDNIVEYGKEVTIYPSTIFKTQHTDMFRGAPRKDDNFYGYHYPRSTWADKANKDMLAGVL